jgi:hypothetical protein
MATAGASNDFAIQRDGRIVLAGARLRGGDAQDSEVICVLRLLPDGRLDSSFSGDGIALLDHGYGTTPRRRSCCSAEGSSSLDGGATALRARASASRGSAAMADSIARSGAAVGTGS